MIPWWVWAASCSAGGGLAGAWFMWWVIDGHYDAAERRESNRAVREARRARKTVSGR